MVDLTIKISTQALGALQEIAGDREAVQAMVSEWLEQFVRENRVRKTKNAFLMIAESAEALGEESEQDDIAERSREILNAIYSEKLAKHSTGYDQNE